MIDAFKKKLKCQNCGKVYAVLNRGTRIRTMVHQCTKCGYITAFSDTYDEMIRMIRKQTFLGECDKGKEDEHDDKG